MPYSAAVSLFASTSILHTLILSLNSSDASSTRGASCLHGPHHSAQKSTKHGSDDLTTSSSKLFSFIFRKFERKNKDLMVYMETHKRTVLLEGTMSKLFAMFNKGKTNEYVTKHFAKKGVNVPETFIKKTTYKIIIIKI